MTCSGSSPVNLDQSPDELDAIYRRGYYHYLSSPEFQEAFLKPLGAIVTRLGAPVLDVGCGAGQLAPFCDVLYHGIDACPLAISLAHSRYCCATKTFSVDRFERYCEDGRLSTRFGTVVFGGMMQVLVKPEKRAELVMDYATCWPSISHIVIYDLEILDTSAFDTEPRLELVDEVHASVDITLEPECKKHRKILLYRVHR